MDYWRQFGTDNSKCITLISEQTRRRLKGMRFHYLPENGAFEVILHAAVLLSSNFAKTKHMTTKSESEYWEIESDTVAVAAVCGLRQDFVLRLAPRRAACSWLCFDFYHKVSQHTISYLYMNESRCSRAFLFTCDEPTRSKATLIPWNKRTRAAYICHVTISHFGSKNILFI